MDQNLTSEVETTSEEPNQSTGVPRSNRSKVKLKEEYVPSMTGKIYEKMMAQLENQVTLHPNAHLLFNLLVEEQPSVVSVIITQLSIKVVLNTWRENGRKAMKS